MPTLMAEQLQGIGILLSEKAGYLGKRKNE
jgi:hypothetical protein